MEFMGFARIVLDDGSEDIITAYRNTDAFETDIDCAKAIAEDLTEQGFTVRTVSMGNLTEKKKVTGVVSPAQHLLQQIQTAWNAGEDAQKLYSAVVAAELKK